ncbi:MAG: hypothetical protein LBJ60_09420 [Tannerellaceae bacterium]|jgi:hypothetical protein|nr:hypothetical protein [Tannerellaceae bacterium]
MSIRYKLLEKIKNILFIMRRIIFPILLLLILGACSGNVDVLDGKLNSEKNDFVFNSELNVNIKKNSGRLVFNSTEDFQNIVSKLSFYRDDSPALRLSSEQNQDNYSCITPTSEITLQKNGFHSLYDDYVNAMNEAENYYDRPNGYEEFKNKYAMLYFPEEGDDYSAYLPVSDINIAKLLNSKGEVVIDGNIVNYKNITTYNQLIELGKVPIEENSNTLSTRATTDYPLNLLPGIKCNDRKLWVNVKIRPATTSGVYEEILVEVCFRKKGFLGAWYNYNSESTLAWEPGLSYHKSGSSSHNYVWAREYKNGPVPFRGLMSVVFRGFGNACGSTKYYFRVDL